MESPKELAAHNFFHNDDKPSLSCLFQNKSHNRYCSVSFDDTATLHRALNYCDEYHGNSTFFCSKLIMK